MRIAVRVFVAALLLLPLATTPANAQYFGRNKVQWENFHFKTLRTEHFDIYYYDQEADVVNDVGRMAERWYSRLSKTFNHTFNRKPIVLYANAADFHQTTTTGGLIGEGTGGFTDEFMNRVVLPLTGDYAENDHVLGHEIVHVFQYDIAASASQQRRRFNLEQLPLWLVEGMAEYFSKGRVDPLTSMWIRDATINDRLPDLRKLSRDPRYFPYRYGQALLAYMGGRFGDETVVRYFHAAGMVGIDQAFDRAVGISSKQLFADWQESARELYNPVVQARSNLTQPLIGKKPIPGKKGLRRSSQLNVGPSLSPDGQYVAFLSSRELFDIDLFLADAKTGRIIRQLASSDYDAHFESLRFIESAGCWSPDGKQLAVISFAKGDNFLTIIDVDTRHIENVRVPGLNAINNVSWSPDGRSIAISGQTTGVSDLFVYDVQSKDVRRLTNDKYADLQPAWSPDGRTIAFVTDRSGGPGIEQLRYDQMGIATIEVSSGTITQLPLFPNTKHINPQYAPDGSLYFIANPEGIPDVYRYRFSDGTIGRVTNVQTGVSGITDLSPALSVAAKSGDIAFSLFEDDSYNIYTLPSSAPSTEVMAMALSKDQVARAAVLPPFRAQGSQITTYLQHPEQGLLPATSTFEQRAYSSDLHLAYLGPPTIGVGGDQYGYGVAGSVSAYFTDILGQQNVGFTFQGTGDSTTSFADQLGGELFYLNQTHRFNWGVDTLHLPYVSSYWSYGIGTAPGTNTVTDVYQNYRIVETISDVSPMAQYPFGPTRRIEGSAGYQRYAYKAELETWYAIGNTIIDRTRERLGDSFSINLFKASTAFVGDSSIFGFVSPVRGTRYRYEVEALTGDLKFDTALADWRKYFYHRPFTLAVRGFHYGRYGSGGEDTRISPLYLGAGDLVRGYDPYGINPALECKTSSGCPVFDRLIGSKIAAGSVELRAPLFGTPEFGLINATFIPTEIFAFGDVGAAWTSNSKVSWKWQTDTNERVPVMSVGAGLRILLSYIPIEFYVAKPFQRPDQSVVYGFNIMPGW
ncbi:MAG TPA: BamA/TamA family outer membrane protein [Thermoanaerobaculia bacterium]|jgi:Tol biopolymer transport system component|nr:BamA/TamA family outer membrane protein [Thermoanaerobaculia bacterium]